MGDPGRFIEGLMAGSLRERGAATSIPAGTWPIPVYIVPERERPLRRAGSREGSAHGLHLSGA